jgi:uncharacterized protein YbjT (DUF2867 family)
MRVLVIGAYGLIGAACLARLHGAGHDLVAAGRSIVCARRRFPYAQWIEADFRRLADAQAWIPLLTGIEAVVNCVGVLQDSSRDRVEHVQFSGTVALFDACVRTGVNRVVHISAIGADSVGPSAFARTKAAADTYLQSLALDWLILRPALVFAPAAYGGTAMLRAIAACPGRVPVIRAEARIQVIGIDDLTETVVWALSPGAPGKVTWDVAHPQVHSLAAIVTALRGWLGFARRPVLRLPDAIGKVVAVVADAVGWLGWRSPARTTSFAQLDASVVGDPGAWMAATGIQPQSLEQLFAARPADVQERWFARLYLLKPLAVVGLAVTAIGIGFAEFTSLWKIAAGLYEISPALFSLGLLPNLIFSAIAIVAGLGLLVRASARIALITLIVLTLVHSAHYGLAFWHSGLVPIDIISVGLPVLLTTLFTLAILDER